MDRCADVLGCCKYLEYIVISLGRKGAPKPSETRGVFEAKDREVPHLIFSVSCGGYAKGPGDHLHIGRQAALTPRHVDPCDAPRLASLCSARESTLMIWRETRSAYTQGCSWF